jgi:hypothetical protein
MFFYSDAMAKENVKVIAKAPMEYKETKINEIIACGYAIFYKNGHAYLCYGEINKMDFGELTDCRKVRATNDKETGRPKEVICIR